MDNLLREAGENLRRLSENVYPGRGIVLGRAPDGQFLQFYWIMGRSENSRNRVFVQEQHEVRTEPADSARMEDPSLVIYTALAEVGRHYLVSNGAHTDALRDVLGAGGSVREALRDWNHEPDAPHFTPRIAGGISFEQGRADAWMGIIKADPFHSGLSNRFYYEFSELAPGFGWCITTYRGDGTPLPAFTGEPFPLPLQADREELAQWLWLRLNERNRISLALKVIDADAGTRDVTIVNKYE